MKVCSNCGTDHAGTLGDYEPGTIGHGFGCALMLALAAEADPNTEWSPMTDEQRAEVADVLAHLRAVGGVGPPHSR